MKLPTTSKATQGHTALTRLTNDNIAGAGGRRVSHLVDGPHLGERHSSHDEDDDHWTILLHLLGLGLVERTEWETILSPTSLSW